MLQIAIIIFLIYCAHIPFTWWYVFIAAGVLDGLRLCFVFFSKRSSQAANIPEAHADMSVPKSESTAAEPEEH